jgi:hypothetical protein
MRTIPHAIVGVLIGIFCPWWIGKLLLPVAWAFVYSIVAMAFWPTTREVNPALQAFYDDFLNHETRRVFLTTLIVSMLLSIVSGVAMWFRL